MRHQKPRKKRLYTLHGGTHRTLFSLKPYSQPALALAGDVVMSLIETAKSAKKNPYKYLLVLHENADWVKVNPNAWLPWNYEDNLTV